MTTISYDRSDNVLATTHDINEMRREIEELPIQCSDGKKFDFDLFSRERIEEAVVSWPPLLTDRSWKMADNTYLTVTAVSLAAYLTELKEKREDRTLALFPEMEALKSDPTTTLRDLQNWKIPYLVL